MGRKLTSLIFISLVCLFILPLQICANSADLTFSTENEIKDLNISLLLGGNLPTDVSGFEININYNQDAFSFISGEGVGHPGINTTFSTSNGVLTIRGESNGGVISTGNQHLARVNLRALSSGSATIVLTNSNFTSANGQPVPGTMLRYYTITAEAHDTTTSAVQNTTTIPTTTISTSSSTNTEETTIELTLSISAETSTNISITTSLSIATSSFILETTDTSTVIPETTLSTSIENIDVSADRGTISNYGLLFIVLAGALVIAIIVISILQSKNRRNK